MKLRNLLIISALTFSLIGFSSCADESENILPQPQNADEAETSHGNDGKDDEDMK